MISSKILQALKSYFALIEQNKGLTLGQIMQNNGLNKHTHFKKGAGGLIIENILGINNNSSKEADLEELGVEIKVLPITMNNRNGFKAKEPTQIKMINFLKVAQETWETAEIKRKINIVFWVVYGVYKENGKNPSQEDYVLLDYFLDHPLESTIQIFKKDWEEIQSYIIRGDGDKLSCSMGTYIEPKTKGKNNLDLTDAPDGKGGITKVRRRAFYFKKKYTNENVIPNLNIEKVN